MVFECVYCKNKPNAEEGITLHKFPINEETSAKWMENMGLLNLKAKSHMRLCSKHFDESCFKKHKSQTVLIRGSLPTIFNQDYRNVCVFCKAKKGGNDQMFHKFPLFDDVLLEKWLTNMNLQEFVPTSQSLLCSDHFESTCYRQNPGRNSVRLKVNAVPTIFPKINLHESPGFRMPSCSACGIYGCDREVKEEKLSFHKFPAQKDILEKWKEFCHIPREDNSRDRHLCSRHFRKEEIIDKIYKRNLKSRYIVPSLERPPKKSYTAFASSIESAQTPSHSQPMQMILQDEVISHAAELGEETCLSEDAVTIRSPLQSHTLDPVSFEKELERNALSIANLLCRMCGNKCDHLLPVHEISSQEELTIAEKMKMHLSVEVDSKDCMPQNICFACCKALNSWHEMYISCRITDAVLQKYFGNAKNKKQNQTIEDVNLLTGRVPVSYNTESIPDIQDNDDSGDMPVLNIIQENALISYPYRCSFCHMFFRFWRELRKHRVQCASSTFLCHTCGQIVANRKYGLYRHRCQLRQFLCHKCGKVMYRKAMQHECKYDKENCNSPGYQCEKCGEILNSNYTLKSHMRWHHRHVCNICSITFKTLNRLHEHKLSHNISPEFYCEPCYRTFPCTNTLKQHQLTHQPSSVKPFTEKIHQESGKTTFICQVCYLEFDSKVSLIAHLNIPQKSWCSKCKMLLQNERKYFFHSLNCMSYPCNFCPQILKSKAMLRDHENRHTGRKAYSCKFCGKLFSTFAQKRNHQEKHVGPKYACDICGQKFYKLFLLSLHLLKHKGVKYTCSICDKAFMSKGNMLKHIRKIHGLQKVVK